MIYGNFSRLTWFVGQKLNSKQLQLGWQAFVSSHHCPEISKADPLLSFWEPYNWQFVAYCWISCFLWGHELFWRLWSSIPASVYFAILAFFKWFENSKKSIMELIKIKTRSKSKINDDGEERSCRHHLLLWVKKLLWYFIRKKVVGFYALPPGQWSFVLHYFISEKRCLTCFEILQKKTYQ